VQVYCNAFRLRAEIHNLQHEGFVIFASFGANIQILCRTPNFGFDFQRLIMT